MVETERGNVRAVGDVSAEVGPRGQLPWYEFAQRFVRGKRVLDVGCGRGRGLRILQQTAALAVGQDVDPRLAGPSVLIVDLEEIGTKTYDVVTAIDVVEHVEHPEPFVDHLGRIARERVFVTTPNWTASRCAWPYHLREYTPREFTRLMARLGPVTLFKGTPSGSIAHTVRHPVAYNTLNDLRTWAPTSVAALCLNLVLPAPYKIYSHNAAWVQLG